MSDGRAAVGRAGPLTVAVPDAVPGDIAEIALSHGNGTAAFGRLVTLVRPSPHRVDPLCRHFGQCGGCQWQRLDAAAQIEHKTALVRRALLAAGLPPLPIRGIPAPSPWGYRTAGSYIPVNGRAGSALGLHAAAGRSCVAIWDCVIQSPPLRTAFLQMQEAWRELDAALWSGPGQITPCVQVRIRVGEASGDVAVGFLYAGRLTARERESIVAVTAARIAGLAALGARPAGAARASRADDLRGRLAAAGSSMAELRWGRRGVVECLLGRWFDVPVFAPFPVTGRGAAQAITEALDALALDGDTALLETDAGIGAYSLAAASRARRVIGRTHPELLAAARHNARAGDVVNVVFVDRTRETLTRSLRAHGSVRRALVRVTRDPVPFQSLHRAGVDRLVLLGASPARLARTLAGAADGGFEPRSITVVDTHPQTSRAEIQAVLDARAAV
jgi:23S rRNA (uracil1939-C5)-methyltransferase